MGKANSGKQQEEEEDEAEGRKMKIFRQDFRLIKLFIYSSTVFRLLSSLSRGRRMRLSPLAFPV